ncbi:MAG: flavin reductase family protein [Candidatus Bathyarchaeota archaeon]|nr:MAG: flavin reductase family protein [Candidatus Bathyarchaeota archaeon]
MKVTLTAEKVMQAGPPSAVVMVTCVDTEKNANIITLGMYMSISFTPRLICIGISPKRYSHDLIVESGEFVVNVPSIDLTEAMDFCGTESGRRLYKFAATGLTPIPAQRVTPPLIQECFGHLECKVVQSYVCGDHTLFVGEVIAASVEEDVLTDGTLDPVKAQPIINKNHVYFTITKQRSVIC